MELPVTLWMLPGTEALAIGIQPEFHLSQQPAYCPPTDGMAPLRKLAAYAAQTIANPFLLAHRIARRLFRHFLLQGLLYSWRFFSVRRRPPPGNLTLSVGRSCKSFSISRLP